MRNLRSSRLAYMGDAMSSSAAELAGFGVMAAGSERRGSRMWHAEK